MNATATLSRRIGNPTVNQALDTVLAEAARFSVADVADRIAAVDVIGEADTTDAGPVGLWVVDSLIALGVDAARHAWVADLLIFDADGIVIGQVHIPEGHTLYVLEGEVADGDHPAITYRGESDPR